MEVVWDGAGYLCVSPDPPAQSFPPMVRQRDTCAPLIALFRQHGPMTVKELHRRLYGTEPTRDGLTYNRVNQLRRQGRLRVFAKGSEGTLYCVSEVSPIVDTDK